jgi:hypothetical protein
MATNKEWDRLYRNQPERRTQMTKRERELRLLRSRIQEILEGHQNKQIGNQEFGQLLVIAMPQWIALLTQLIKDEKDDN